MSGSGHQNEVGIHSAICCVIHRIRWPVPVGLQESIMLRFSFEHNGLKFSCLDAGGSGQALIALHAHWMEGQPFASLATALAPEWRGIAPDQRCHGDSDHAPTYARSDYLDDL